MRIAENILNNRVDVNSQSNVILLSDGQDTNNFQATGVSGLVNLATIHSVGIGADHDVNLLSKLAELGRGKMSYAANAASIANGVGATWGSIQTVVARDAVITIDGARTFLGNLSAGDSRSFFIKGNTGKSPEVTLRYKSVCDENEHVHACTPTFQMVKQPVAQDVLIQIDLAKNREMVASVLKQAADAHCKEGKRLLGECRDKLSKSISSALCATLIQSLTLAMDNFRDRTRLTAMASNHARQSGGAYMTPLAMLTSERFETASQRF